jgi:hypothetical protein
LTLLMSMPTSLTENRAWLANASFCNAMLAIR